jgi:flagellar hook-associated protein 1
MANGMASLFVGASGLKSAQTALNTTAHNLSNINTDGYTRQQIAFRDTHYLRIGGSYASPSASVYGLGVGISEIRRIRDEFIDKAYRTENGRLGYYSNQYKAIEEVEDQFGELQGVTFQDALNNLYTAINELSKEPASTVKRSSLIQNASALVTRSDAIYSGLKDYQETLNIDVANAINKINAYGEKIFSLNKQIAKIEGTGVENANDLRDQRDKALDELSEYIDISYYEVQGGEIYVNAGGVPFVTMSSYTQMSSRTNDDSTLLIPTWPAFERDVYPETELYSALTDKDKGGLKGTLLARGSIEVDYTDIPVKPDKADYDLTTVDGKAAYDKDYAKYQEKQEYYNKYIEPSVILSALAGVDKLMNGIVTKINDVLCPEKDMKLKSALTDENGNEIMPNSYSYTVSDAVLYDKYKNEVKGFDNGDGTYSYESSEPLYTDKDLKNKAGVTSYNYTVLDMDKTDYGMDEDKTVGTEIFGRLNTKRYIKMKDANGNDMYVHNNQNEKGDRSEYKLGNIIMNSVAEQDIAKIPMTTLQGKEDMAKGQELIDAWNGAVLYDKYKNEVKGFDNGDGTYSYESSEPLYTDKDLKNKAGVTSYNYTVLDMDKTDYGMDEDKTVGTEIFGRLNTKRYIKMKDANGNDMYVHNNQNEKGDRSEYKLGNIIMNSVAEQDIAKIPMTTLQGKEDMAKGQELIDAWNGDFASINPQMYAVGNFSTYYNNFIGEFSTVGKVLYNYVDHQQTMVDGYDDQRLQSEGVASDEELEKMIKYQQAYNASSRYVNVISEMLEHIVTALGS